MEDSVAQQPTNKAYDTNLLASPFYQHEEGNGEYEFPLKIVVNSEQNLPVQMQVPKQKYGTILEQCNSYKSCMHLQKELLLMGSGDIDMMLLEAKYEFRELLLHKYGNYFVTTLIQMCNEVQRMYFLQAIESAIVDGCMSAYGIHPLQALLSLKLTAKEVDIIRNQIQNKLCAICENEHGMYVAIKLMSFIEDERDIIFKEILHDFINLSQTEKGLNVIKKFIVELKSIHAQYLVIAQIMQNPIQYIEHYYSNYAYQLIIKHWSRECIRPLFECVVGCVCYLSNQKCSSNVIETLMTNAPVELLPIYIKEITDSILSTFLHRLA